MLVLAVPVVGFSAMFSMLLGYQLPAAGWVGWISPLLGTVMYVWGGRPFLTGAVGELRAPTARDDAAHRAGHHGGLRRLLGRQPGPARPRARLLVGAGAADRDHAARPLDRDAVAGPDHLRAGLAGRAAARSRPNGSSTTWSTAPWRRPSCGSATWSWSDPAAGCPPTGGSATGSASMDESMITGESRPVRRGEGDTGRGRHRGHRLRAAGRDHRRRRRHRAGRHPTPGRRGAELHLPGAAHRRPGRGLAVLVRAVGRRRSPPSSGPLLGLPDEAVVRTITVLVIACPHALGLAIPLVVSIATERAARGGVLIKDRLALECMRTVDTVLFDKTGTLTKGRPTVTAVHTGRRSFRGRGPRPRGRAPRPTPSTRWPAPSWPPPSTAASSCTRPSDFASSPAVGVTATVDGRRVQCRRTEPAARARGCRAAGRRRSGAPRARSSCTSSSTARSSAP